MLYCRRGWQGDVHREQRQTASGNGQRENSTGHPQSGQLLRRDQHLEHGNGGEQANSVRQVRGILGPLLPLQAGHVGCPEGLSAARIRLEAIAVKRLEKYKKEEDGKKMTPRTSIPSSVSMGRSRSTPGLVESRGKKCLWKRCPSRKTTCSPRVTPAATQTAWAVGARQLAATSNPPASFRQL
ncbi:hypothetical protein CEXT_192241 [Caerostris extrusa]|uniref:Uncharacterized protein n=1 Tax=Caerostris extrusa TaxID=172846 RepID=A0AAV4WU48_CAEEX|nr:hypothetical protein CEXT_192241 [Caerostris extrusa]